MKHDFPESRYRHCYGVGMRMYDYAKNILHWDDEKSMQMFVLGNVHDIGYEFESSLKGHDELIANALQGFPYAEEVRNHSRMQNHFSSPEMDLLYFADSTVDGMGKWCTFDERLKDIENRYGLESECYKESLAIKEYLDERGFDDRIQLQNQEKEEKTNLLQKFCKDNQEKTQNIESKEAMEKDNEER